MCFCVCVCVWRGRGEVRESLCPQGEHLVFTNIEVERLGGAQALDPTIIRRIQV
jgi:hypothetical protein